ncbi:MAG: hypothetical protein IJ819_12165 [Clostridiales bacterium]|nr:hypothetical protein [Clostridiales bacterium]
MLMDYDEFKERVMNEFIDYLPERYSDCVLELHQVPKLNEVLTGIAIKPREPCKAFIAPTFYMERLYSQYEESGSFERTMSDQAIYLEESIKFIPKNILSLDFSKVKEKIVFQIVNTADNMEMLIKCPHRNFEDLSVVYRAITGISNSGVSGFLITNDIAEVEGLTENELYQFAFENTKRLFPFKSERIEVIMRRLMRRWGADEEEIKEAFPGYTKTPLKERVYVVTNKHDFFGANALLYNDVIADVAKKIGTDCYILPSSVHDLIVLSTEIYYKQNKLANIVKTTNNESVRPSERLSDSVYMYSISDGSITRASLEEDVS